jgi:manganese transport protein
LIHFTSNRKNMDGFATPRWAQALAWLTATIIVGLNAQLVLDNVKEWVAMASQFGGAIGPVPASLAVAVGLYTLVGAVGLLLIWVTVKPWVAPSPPWKREEPGLVLDWADALRPRPLERVGVALEHSPADAEILNRALSLAGPETRLVLLHVADTPLTSVIGAEAADRHTEADSRYLDEVARVLEEKGYHVRSILLHGPDRAGELVAQIRKEPVDLLVVGSHGHGLVRDLMLGQTVDKVRHGLDTPMLIARPDRLSSPVEPAKAVPASQEPDLSANL